MSKLKIPLLFLIAFISIVVVLFSFSVQEVFAAVGWFLPTGANDLGGGWSSEEKAYDVDATPTTPPTTYAQHVYTETWSGFLELLNGTGSNCSKIRFYAFYGYESSSYHYNVDVDAYYNSTWNNVYQGIYTDKAWVEKPLGTTAFVTKARISFNPDSGVYTRRPQLYEFDFYGEIPITAPTVTTDIASVNLQGETATLNGTLNGLGGASSCDVRFEYRKPGESGYPNVTPWQTISVDNTPFSATIGAPEGFTPQTVAGNTYVYRAVAQNTAGTSYGPTDKQVVIYTASGGQQSFTTLPSTYTLTVSKTGTGSGTVTDTGINCGTDCSEAYNLGTSVTLTATPDANSTFAGWSTSWACGNTVTFTYKGSPVTYGTVASQGKCWLDSNLGASQVATLYNDSNAYGDLFQWGRLGDGHQTRTSGTTTTLSITDTPVDSNFIYGMGSPYDWRSPQNDNLWQGVSGTNNPCPSGWRLPTSAELDTERASWSQQNYNGAFASPLRLTAAGYRNYSDASLGNVGSYGGYWSSTVDRTFGIGERITSSDISIQVFNRALGFSVRCLKDEIEECSGTGTCTLPMDSDKNVTATFNSCDLNRTGDYTITKSMFGGGCCILDGLDTDINDIDYHLQAGNLTLQEEGCIQINANTALQFDSGKKINLIKPNIYILKSASNTKIIKQQF